MPRPTDQRDPIPDVFGSLQEFWDFWDDHSLADYEDHLCPLECRVSITRRTKAVPLEPKLLQEISALAHTRGVSCETLINLRLRDRVMAETGTASAGAAVP